jgi:hypothetical protein
MGAFSDLVAFLSGTPALVGLLLAALVIFLTSDWRVSLAAVLVQYVLSGLLLTHNTRAEVVLVKILVGFLVVVILLLSAQRIRRPEEGEEAESAGPRLLGLRLGWLKGPLGFPLRLLAVFLAVLALAHLFGDYHLPAVPLDMALAAFWLGAMGVLGLVLSSSPLRVAVAVLTILTGFDLVYSGLEPSLAMVGFLCACSLIAALAFAYLTAVHELEARQAKEKET